jgi:DNA-directed RNA polymerase specialized sigma24 family protein
MVNLSPEIKTLIALKAGDEGAFRAIFDAHFKKLYPFCYKMVKDKEQAEEIVNDTFERLGQSQ